MATRKLVKTADGVYRTEDGEVVILRIVGQQSYQVRWTDVLGAKKCVYCRNLANVRRYLAGDQTVATEIFSR